ncbi:hypothetical protein H3C65_01500, partial [Patescibacteria group bacterium]|nr:hypothetical protein [Patescibacteria group bacterium]
ADSYLAGGSLGIGTQSPDAKLEISATSEQLRLTHTDNTYDARFTVDGSGNLNIDVTGTQVKLADNLEVAGTTGLTLSGVGGDITFANGEKIDNDTDGTINISSTTFSLTGTTALNATSLSSIDTSSALTLGTTTLTLDSNSTINGGTSANDDLTLQGTSNATRETSYVLLQPNGGKVGIGTTSPSSTLEVVGSSRFNGSTINLGGPNGIGDQGSMIPNSGFEINDDSDTTTADGWTSSTTSGINPQVNSVQYVQGNYSQRLYSTSTTSSILTSQCIPVTDGTTYNFYAWVRSNMGNTGDGLYVRFVSYTDGSCTTGAANANIVNNSAVTSTWTKYGGTTAALTGVKSVQARIQHYQPNTDSYIYIDAVRVTPSALTNTIDLAENYYTNQTLIPGQIVRTSRDLLSGVEKTDIDNDQKIIGIVSTNPAITLGEGIKSDKSLVKVALAGRVPAIVSTKNGSIDSGDLITSSNLFPGVGVKAISYGYTVGKALESTESWNSTQCTTVPSINSISWSDDDGSDKKRECFMLPDGTLIGKIMVFVNLSWYDPLVYLTSTGDFDIRAADASSSSNIAYDGLIENDENINNNQNYNLFIKDQIVDRIGAFSEVIVAKIKSGFIETKNLITDNLVVKTKLISPIVETADLVATGTAKLNNIRTDEIKPIAENIILDLSETQSSFEPESSGSGKLAQIIIKGLQGKTVTTIDSSGNIATDGNIYAKTASFSGQIVAQSLSINTDATISGNLSADKILASEASISGTLTAKEINADNVNSLSSNIQDINTNINEIQQLIAGIQAQPLPDPNNYQNIADQQFNKVKMAELTVTGNSNFYNISISGSVLAGTTLIEDSSITSLASELKISALSAVNFFDGAVKIAKNGSMTVQGELIAQGGIRTDEIKPIVDDGYVSIDNLSVDKLAVTNKYLDATSSAVVIAAPDNFNQNGIFAPAINTASSSAGIALLPDNSNEVIVYNDNIKKDSLIYLTPTSQSTGRSLAVVDKVYNAEKPYFKVVINQPINIPVKFNWLIVN